MQEEVQVKITGSNETGAAFGELKTQLQDTAKNTASAAEKIAGLERQFKSLAVGGGLAFGALAYAGTQLTQIGAQSESVAFAFGRMTEQAGIATNDLLNSLRDASAGTIAETDLMLTANKAIALGVGEDLETMTTLMEVARLKGQNMGLTTTQAFNDIATGIGRGSPLILDNLGITIKLGEAQENYARELGKTVTEMTDAEKKQALLNAVLKEGRAELEATGEVQLTASEQLQQMSAQMDDLKSAVGEAIAPAFIGLGESIAGVLEKVTAFAQENPTLVRALFTTATAVAGLTFAVGSLGVAFIGFTKASAAATAALAPFGVTVGALALPVLGLVAVLGSLAIAYGLISDAAAKSTAVFDAASAAIDTAAGAWSRAEAGITSFDTKIADLTLNLETSNARLAELGESAADIAEQMADAIKESEERQKGYKQDKANAFLDQEEKIADIEASLLDEREKVRDAERERRRAKDDYADEEITQAQYRAIRKRTEQAKEAANEQIATLEAQLLQETTALANAGELRNQLGEAIAEAERFRNLTEFEQKLETIALQEQAEQERLAKKLAQLGAEQAAIAKQQAEIRANIAETQAAIVETEKQASRERIDAAFAEAKAVINAEMQKAYVREQSVKKYERALDELTKKQIEANKALDADDGTLARLRAESQAIADSIGRTEDVTGFEQFTRGFGGLLGDYSQGVNRGLAGFWNAITPQVGGRDLFSVQDAIITPKGDVVQTAPEDYIIATKTPEKLAGAGGVTINISGTFMDDRAAAGRLASEIMRQLGRQQRIDRR